VTPIDTVTNQPGTPITVGAGAGAIAITPNGRTAYIATDGGVVPLATATGTPGPAIAVDATSIAITPNGKTVWVTTPAGTIVPIPTATKTPGTPLPIGARAAAIAITPDGSTAYVVGDFDPGTVVPVNLAKRTVGTPIVVGNVPRGIAITPNGRTAWVTNTGQVWPIDIATNVTGAPITVGDLLFNIAISPNGRIGYVTDDRHQEVTRINLVTRRVAPSIEGGYLGVAITPDGAKVYATSDVNILPIDAATNTAGKPIPVSAGSIAITPDQAPDAKFTAHAARHGSHTRLDGSASVATTGKIVRWAWRFGDGTGAALTKPVVFHTYARAGTYPVRLTVTDSAGTSTTKVFTGQTLSRNGGPRAVQYRHVSIP
jgi:DNA-binding beta-propeller fold protein YncE